MAEVKTIFLGRAGVELFDDWDDPLDGIDTADSARCYDDLFAEKMLAVYPGALIDFSMGAMPPNIWVPWGEDPDYTETRRLTEEVRAVTEQVAIFMAQHPDEWLVETPAERDPTDADPWDMLTYDYGRHGY